MGDFEVMIPCEGEASFGSLPVLLLNKFANKDISSHPDIKVSGTVKFNRNECNNFDYKLGLSESIKSYISLEISDPYCRVVKITGEYEAKSGRKSCAPFTNPRPGLGSPDIGEFQIRNVAGAQ